MIVYHVLRLWLSVQANLPRGDVTAIGLLLLMLNHQTVLLVLASAFLTC